MGPDYHDCAKRRAPMGVRWGMLGLGLVILSACTVLPTGPNVLVLPAVGKPVDVFRMEEGECRAYAQQQLGVAPEQAASTTVLQVRYDRAYVQCMYAKGNVVPGMGTPGATVPPPPSGTPPPSVPQR
jgi:hypothetical protein